MSPEIRIQTKRGLTKINVSKETLNAAASAVITAGIDPMTGQSNVSTKSREELIKLAQGLDEAAKSG